jgi:nitric oxide synthase oxygenase domain/subunit
MEMMNFEMELINVEDEDAKELTDTAIETDALKEIFDNAKNQGTDPTIIAEILKEYMQALKNHKTIWNRILVKYVGSDNASKFYRIYRFDMYKKVIFKQQIEGCALCAK